MANEKNNTFFGGAAVLAAGIIIVKLIGALYKIPLSSILGDDGYAHFNNAYVIFNLLLTVSTAGLPVALSKTISEANALGRGNQVHRVFRVALVTFFVLGTITCIVMLLFAQPLARWQGDGLAYHAVLVMAPTCFFVCVLSTFRGYAQGHSNMVPTSISQILEAIAKLVIGLGLAWYMVKVLNAPSEIAAAGGILGVTAGAVISLLYLVVNHFGLRRRETRLRKDTPDSHLDILKRLAIIAIPITIGASVAPITTWLDTFQVQNILRETMNVAPAEVLKAQGLLDPVSNMYGAYQRAINPYNLPAAFMIAITASVIPAISACRTRHDKVGAGRIAESSLRVSMLLALPAGVGLTVLASPIMHLLAWDTDHTVADPALAVLGIASIFVCTTLLCNSILQANGFVNLPIVVMIVGCGAKLAVNYVLVSSIGIAGAPVGTLVCYVIISLLELLLIKRVIPSAPSYGRVFAKPLIASILMGGAAAAVSGLLTKLLMMSPRFVVMVEEIAVLSKMGNAIATFGAIAVGGTVYVVLVVALGAISKEDLSLMPKGDKIAKLLRL